MKLDVLILGGGVAGLWLLDELHRRGRRALLVEAAALGAGQTICAQGIIHGGIKYSLDGVRTSSTATIREMPDVWRAALAGQNEPDLCECRVLSPRCYLWRTGAWRSRAGMLGAKLALRTPVDRVADERRPEVLRGCPGEVLAVEEPVLDVVSLLATLARRHAGRMLAVAGQDAVSFARGTDGRVDGVTLRHPAAAAPLELRPWWIVLTAGAGSEALRDRLGLPAGAMQRRPLHMVLVRGPLPELFGHCIDGSRTRVTVTSYPLADGRRLWHVGGQVAEDGVSMEPAALIAHAKAELQAVLPGLTLDRAEWATYRVDRAEGRTAGGARPEDCTVRCEGNVVTAWPTKLALAPRLAGQVMERIATDSGRETDGGNTLPDWPAPAVAPPPWEVAREWHALD